MVEFKIVIGDPRTGTTSQKEVKDDDAKRFMGLRIGDKLKGDFLGLGDVEIEVTGGSDSSGFPMRKDVAGIARKRILATAGIGIRTAAKGVKIRKTVAGNTVHAKTAQVNVKVITSERPQKQVKEKKPKEKKDKPAAAEKAEKKEGE